MSAEAISSATVGNLASTAVPRARMCYRAVRGSIYPSASEASSVNATPDIGLLQHG